MPMKIKKGLLLLSLINLMLLACNKKCDEWHDGDAGNCVAMREKFIGTWIGGTTASSSTVVHPDTIKLIEGQRIYELSLSEDINFLVVASNQIAAIDIDTFAGIVIYAEWLGHIEEDKLKLEVFVGSSSNMEERKLYQTFVGQKQ